MKQFCNEIQTLIAEKGPSALRDDRKAQDHVAECSDCFDFLEALTRINETLTDTSGIDAPDEVVEELLITIEELAIQDKDSNEGKIGFLGKSVRMVKSQLQFISKCMSAFLILLYPYRRGITYGFLIVMVFGITFTLITPKFMSHSDKAKMYSRDRLSYTDVESEPDMEFSEIVTKQAPKPSAPPVVARERYDKKEQGVKEKKKTLNKVVPLPEEEAFESIGVSGAGADRFADPVKPSAGERRVEGGVLSGLSGKDLNRQGRLASDPEEIPEALLLESEEVEFDDDIAPEGKLAESEPIEKTLSRKNGFLGKETALTTLEEDKALSSFDESEVIADDDVEIPTDGPDEQVKKDKPLGKKVLETFLNDRASLENLSFKKAEGYWANTYLPGDPMYRWLGSRLKQWDRSDLASYANKPVGLDNNARRVAQPFDPPVNAALGVYLHTDRKGIQEKTRMLVQVGLKGTPRLSGTRQGMNVGIVLDLRGDISNENISCIKALLTAFEEARDMGDRFSLTIAGKPGGVVITPGNFRYGHLMLAVKQLFGEDKLKGDSLSVYEAFEQSKNLVSSGDDPSAPLGSSVVVLVTTQSLSGFVNELADAAHNSSVDGVPVSVVGIGSQVQPDQLNRIIYSGQGNKRLFEKPSDAERVVEQELTAVSRVIARAVRLRIRLAKGVRLVDVFDSYRLDETMAQKVRDAEKSIDLRMSKNLGIKADRGEDEDGIQIVIPAFYAGDSHVVLLDVVASGPGPVADVTVRYKDLVKLKNGVARANLSLDRRTALPGPLERNVLKNYLAWKLSEVLTISGDALSSGDDEQAYEILRNHLDLLVAIQSSLPGFRRDLDISEDIEMLDGYLTVITRGVDGIQNQRGYLSDSLKFAGKLKVLPRLNE